MSLNKSPSFSKSAGMLSIAAQLSSKLNENRFGGKIQRAGYLFMETINKKFWQKAWSKKYVVIAEGGMDVFENMDAVSSKKAIVHIEFSRFVTLVDINNHKNQSHTFGIKVLPNPDKIKKDQQAAAQAAAAAAAAQQSSSSSPPPKRKTSAPPAPQQMETYFFYTETEELRDEWFAFLEKQIEEAKEGSKRLTVEVTKLIEKGQLKEFQRLVNDCEFHPNAKIFLLRQYMNLLKEKNLLEKLLPNNAAVASISAADQQQQPQKPNLTLEINAASTAASEQANNNNSSNNNSLAVPSTGRQRSRSQAYALQIDADTQNQIEQQEELEEDDPELIKSNYLHLDSMLHVAAKHGHASFITFLIGKQANPNIQNSLGLTPLHAAFACPDTKARLEVVKALIAGKANVNVADVHQQVPLLFAARLRDWASLSALLEAGAFPEIQDLRDGQTSLHETVATGEVEPVVSLLSKGADPNARNANEQSSCDVAASVKARDVLYELLKAKGTVNLEFKDFIDQFLPPAVELGLVDMIEQIVAARPELANYAFLEGKSTTTLLIHAIVKKQANVVRLLLSQPSTQPDMPELVDNVTFTPLHRALMTQQDDIILAVADKANCNQHSGAEDLLPYHLAAKYAVSTIAKSRILARALSSETSTSKSEEEMLSVRTKTGQTLLHLAAEGGDIETLKAVMTKNVLDIHTVVTNVNQGVLSAACEKGKLEAVKFLCEEVKVDPLGTGKETYQEGSYPPLHSAILSGNLDVVKYLVEQANVSIEYTKKEGQMKPLLFAAFHGKTESVEYLLDKGANTSTSINIVDDKQISSLHLAAGYGHVAIVALLIDKGKMDPKGLTQKGQTPLDFAMKRSQLKVIRALSDRGVVTEDQMKMLSIQFGSF